MASAAKATGKGYVSARIYFDEADWNDLRHHAIDENVSASAIVVALVRRYQSDPNFRAEMLEQARELSQGRRRRQADDS